MADSDGKVRIIIDTNADKAVKELEDVNNAVNGFDGTRFVSQANKIEKSIQYLSDELHSGADFKDLSNTVKEAEERLRDLAIIGEKDSQDFRELASSLTLVKQNLQNAQNAVKEATGNTKNLGNNAQNAAKKTNELNSSINRLAKDGTSISINSVTDKLKGLAGAYIGIRGAQAVYNNIMQSTEAFRAQEHAVSSLNITLQNAGVYSSDYSKHIQELASRIQSFSNYGDEAVIKSWSLGQAFIGQTRITDELAKATVDFAAATKMDLESAFTLVGKSIGSPTNALGRYGVQLKKGMSDSQKMAAITAQLAGRYEGQARQMANASQQLKNSVGDLSEAIGSIFNPTVENTQKILIKATNALTDFINKTREAKADFDGLTIKGLEQRIKSFADMEAKYQRQIEQNKKYGLNSNFAQTQLDSYRDARIRAEKELEQMKKVQALQNTSNKTPVKISDEFLKSGTTAKHIKDDYEKLQEAAEKARRQVELVAIRYGTSSQQVRNAFVNYTNINNQLTAIEDIFKIEESKTKFQELQEQITQTTAKLQDLYLTGQGDSAEFLAGKNELVQMQTQLQDMNTAITSSIGLDWEQVSASVKSNLSAAILTPLSQGESAFNKLATIGLNAVQLVGQEIIKNLLKEISLDKTKLAINTAIAAVKKAGSFFGFGFANGAAFENGKITAFAKGGVVKKPTMFPMANGAAGLMGEAGAEAVVPLRRMSNGRLGVEASQNNGQGFIVNIYNQSNSQIETRQRDNNTMDIIIKRVNEALMNERTSSGFRSAYQRETTKGIQAV